MRELYELSTPNGLRAARILPGTNGKIAVIGRGQDSVEAFAKFLRSQGRDVETLKNVPGIDELWLDFRRIVEEKRGILGPKYQLTIEELMNTGFYKTDERWILGVRDKGFTIIDMGDPMKRGSSDFPNMEYRHTFE